MQKLALARPLPTQEEERQPLDEMVRELVDEIRADAADQPEVFLAETVVPFGGE